MTDLLIRDLDSDLHARLERRAQEHRRSIEEEVRETLRVATVQDAETPATENLMDLATRLFGPHNGVDLDLPPRKEGPERPPVDFSGPEYDR